MASHGRPGPPPCLTDAPPLEVLAPTRVDLAGGTLDLWPLYVFHPGSMTVNAALRLGVRVRVRPGGAPPGRIRHGSPGTPPVELGPQDAGHHLTAAVGFHFIPEGGFSVEVLEQPPVGSGLGASSALAVALARACLALRSRRLRTPGLVTLLKDLEAAVLAAPTGVQDYYPALLGGALAINLEPGGERVERLPVPLAWIEERLVVVFSGVAHASGMVNWEVYRARVDGDARVADALAEIAAAAAACRHALLAGDGDAVGRAIAAEWEARRRLAPAVAGPTLDAILAAGRGAGALAGKACGAGGGGSVLFWVRPGRRAAVSAAALGAAPAGAFEIPGRLAARGATIRTGTTVRRGSGTMGRRRA
jgi:D-glycero-alpha-D-manno-heptose-7-phosphate kinase